MATFSVSKPEPGQALSGSQGWFEIRCTKVRAWGRDCSTYTTQKFLPGIENAYRENKTWCHWIGGISLAGAACTVIPYSWLAIGGAGFSLGTLFGRGMMEDASSSDATGEVLRPGGPEKSLPSNMRITVSDTLSGISGVPDETVEKLMEIFCALLERTIDLVEMADDLAEQNSVWLVDSLFNKGKRTCDPVTKEQLIAMARKELKTLNFIRLVHYQETAEDISDTVYDVLLKAKREANFSRMCNSQRVDYKNLLSTFLAFAERAQKDKKLLDNPANLSFLLGQVTAGWNAPDRKNKAQEAELKALIADNCKAIRRAFESALEPALEHSAAEAAADLSVGSACRLPSTPPCAGSSSDASLRYRPGQGEQR